MIGKGTLVGRIAEVSDVVGWVLFLCTPEAGYLTGQTLAVNGGRLVTRRGVLVSRGRGRGRGAS